MSLYGIKVFASTLDTLIARAEGQDVGQVEKSLECIR